MLYSDAIKHDYRKWAAGQPPEVRFQLIAALRYDYPDFALGAKFLKRFHFKSEKLKIYNTGKIGAIIGEFRSGKTCLVQSSFSFEAVEREGHKEFLALYVECRKDWDKKEFGRGVMTTLGRPPKLNISVATLNTKTFERMEQLGVKLLVLDEFHLLLANPALRDFALDLIRSIHRKGFCNVLLVGPTEVEAVIKKRKDLFGSGNFPRAYLSDFDTTGDQEYRYKLFLGGIDDRLPFRKPTNFLKKEFYNDLRNLSRGSPGLSMNLIRAAADLAVEDNSDALELDHFRVALKDQTGNEGIMAGEHRGSK